MADFLISFVTKINTIIVLFDIVILSIFYLFKLVLCVCNVFFDLTNILLVPSETTNHCIESLLAKVVFANLWRVPLETDSYISLKFIDVILAI